MSPTPDRWRDDVRSHHLSRRLNGPWRRLRRAVLARRRLLAAVLAGMAVLTGVRAASLPPAETTPVVVAAADLTGGTRLGAGDLKTVQLPVAAAPAGTSASIKLLEGRTLAAPLRDGEPVTDVRLVAPGLLQGFPGMVATPVRIADPAAVRLLAAGDRVDLVAVPPEGGQAAVVAEAAPVVAVPRASSEDGLVGGALVVVALPESVAPTVVEASVTAVLSVVLER